MLLVPSLTHSLTHSLIHTHSLTHSCHAHYIIFVCEFHFLYYRLDSEGLDLMNKLLRFQSDKRMTAAEAMKHNFFKCFGPRIHELSHSELHTWEYSDCK